MHRMAGSVTKRDLGASFCPLPRRVDAAISAWAAARCKKSLGEGSSPRGAKEHAVCVKAAKGRELAALRKFHVFEHSCVGDPSNAVANSRWALTRVAMDGQSNVMARPVPKGS